MFVRHVDDVNLLFVVVVLFENLSEKSREANFNWHKKMESECELPRDIIIDNGSEMLKAGFSGDEAPRAVFPEEPGG